MLSQWLSHSFSLSDWDPALQTLATLALLMIVALLAGYIMQSGGFGSSGFGMYAGF